MKNKNRLKITNMLPLLWGLLILFWFVLLFLLGPARGNDIYDIQAGMRAHSQQPLLVVAAQIVFAWTGVALVFLVLSFYKRLSTESPSDIARAATVFGLISGSMFMFSGLVGGFSSFDLIYIQSVRSPAYVQDAYLPLGLLVNRSQAAAITVSGLWFAMVNLLALRNQALPQFIAYLGVGAGTVALLGFVLPGGGFSLLSLLLGALWGILSGLSMDRNVQQGTVITRDRRYNVDKS